VYILNKIISKEKKMVKDSEWMRITKCLSLPNSSLPM
jgi:hypothetical protein